LGYPTFIHEQNSIPGKCNKFLSKHASLIGVSFESSAKDFPQGKTIFTGNPCSEDALKKPEIAKSEFGLSDSKKLILIVMGSLGSSKINNFFKESISMFKNKDYEVLYVTGKDSYDSFKKLKAPNNVKIVPYIENMTRIMKKTDIIVSRAGASTLSEITALNIPSILIPSPYVPDNHQFKNAMDLVNNGSAVMLEETELKGDALVRTIDALINDSGKIKKIRSNLKKMSVPNSATLIYDNIRRLIDRK